MNFFLCDKGSECNKNMYNVSNTVSLLVLRYKADFFFLAFLPHCTRQISFLWYQRRGAFKNPLDKNSVVNVSSIAKTQKNRAQEM